MKKLRVILDLSSVKDLQPPLTQKEWFIKLFDAACGSGFQGLTREQTRLYIKISDKIEKAKEEVELEDTEFGFFKEAFDKAKFLPGISRVVNQIYDRLE